MESSQNDETPLPPAAAFALDIGLSQTGDAGSSYHFQNDPSDPLQRKNWTERKGVVDIRATCLDVVHGVLGEQTPVFCTLLVLEFCFDPRKQGRRILSAEIELRFSGSKAGGGSDIEVAQISPVGRLSLVPSSQEETTTLETEVSAGSASSLPVDVGAGWKWSRSVSRTVNDAATIVGSIDMLGRTWGKKNSASWTLMENRMTKSGVPSMMRAAVRLHRQTEEPFTCEFGIRAKADWQTSLTNLLGSTPPDDPVFFDPTLPSTNNLQEYDELALGSLDLESLSDITHLTIFENAMKRK
ncbi:uncharacterized protein B0T15DRAFT_537651 [Chaetomium strumarium]|uniref:Uncharacterized protein n=1 Tax=Chaetomium strumarium TaxID=1170767 RepID=A0AAJ0GRZ3_9PEZI|nr:hypothetical protein B0T15DRAFT_537651 [Chaetomium strumarium]